MKKSMILLLALSVMLFSNVLAEQYVYYSCYPDHTALVENEMPNICYLKNGDKKGHILDMYGYIIENNSSNEGVAAVILSTPEIDEIATISFFEEGTIVSSIERKVPQGTNRILAIDDDYTYYFYRQDDDYGVRRISLNGTIETYGINHLFVDDGTFVGNTLFTINSDGMLAFICPEIADFSSFESFFAPDCIFVCSPGGIAKKIAGYETDYGYGCVWTDNDCLITVSENFEIMKINTDKESLEFIAEMERAPYNTNIGFAESHSLIAFQEYNPPKILGFIPTLEENKNRIVLLNYETGKVLAQSEYVYVPMESQVIEVQLENSVTVDENVDIR